MTDAPIPSKKKRRRRKRKPPVAIVPVASQNAGPPQPGPIVGEVEEKALRGVGDVAYADEEDRDDIPAPVGIATGDKLTIDVPLRMGDVLDWFAKSQRQTRDQAAAGLLRHALARMRPAWRAAVTGTNGGTVRPEDLAGILD